MTNHPNRSRSYWYSCARGFANEYSVGIATSKAHAEQYESEGFERIDRDRALREMVYRGDDATQAYVIVSIDGNDNCDRFSIARNIRAGQPIKTGIY
jgi:hypothetical protein